MNFSDEEGRDEKSADLLFPYVGSNGMSCQGGFLCGFSKGK